MTSVTASAPGRVNLIGEHLDYNGGRCLPIAIPCRTRVTVTPGFDGQLSVTSGGLSWSGLPVERAEGWAAYIVGVLWALGVEAPLEITVDSEVPIGAGLSSSAALTCATALAVDDLLALGRSRDDLVAACMRTENEYVGAPTGGMDQMIALYAERGAALLLDFATGARTQVALDPASAGYSLLVVGTGVSHALVDGAYAARRADCERAAALLGVTYLAQAPAAAVRTLTDGRLRRRATHVVSDQARVDAFVTAVEAGRWLTAGAMMTASHRSLRDDFEVSCAELDVVVATALAAGARGARMTGGGFGGSAIVLVPTDKAAGVGAAVSTEFARNGWEAPTVFPVEASAGAVLELS